jgi:hypothetical protein
VRGAHAFNAIVSGFKRPRDDDELEVKEHDKKAARVESREKRSV